MCIPKTGKRAFHARPFALIRLSNVYHVGRAVPRIHLHSSFRADALPLQYKRDPKIFPLSLKPSLSPKNNISRSVRPPCAASPGLSPHPFVVHTPSTLQLTSFANMAAAFVEAILAGLATEGIIKAGEGLVGEYNANSDHSGIGQPRAKRSTDAYIIN